MRIRTLIFWYAITLFMMIWGLDIIRTLVLRMESEASIPSSPFSFTQIIYITATFLSVRWAFFTFYPQKKYGALTLGILFIFAGYIALRYLLEEVLFKAIFGYGNYFEEVSLIYYTADNIGYAAYDVFIGVLLFFLEYNLIRKKRIELLESKHREAEAAFLQTQFSPHFLFNSLNNIYALMQDDKDAAGNALIKLADLMRAITHEKQHLIPLERELQYCQAFIDLQRLRSEHILAFDIQVEPACAQTPVPPFMLVGCIENACKHGHVNDSESPVQLHVKKQANNTLITIRNSIGNHYKDSTGGIGLQNMRDRLQVLYPGKHKLQIVSENNEFCITLELTHGH